jgi:ankyrin repeat protein
MKLVREHINEKFTDEESDPIRDMGIGLLKQLKDAYKQRYSYRFSRSSENPDPTMNDLLDFCIGDPVYPLSTIKYLLEAGADPNNKIHYDSSLSSAVHRGIDFVKLFIEKGAKLKTANGSDAFIAAIGYSKLDVAQLLLDNGANIHGRGDLALRQTVRNGNKPAIVKWLLEKGANPNTHGYYALQKSLKYKDYDSVDMLIKKYEEDRKK